MHNVRNLPKGNLTVKPDPSETIKGHPGSGLLVYSSAPDTKYAKTTLLGERNSEMALNTTSGQQDNGLYLASTSTPLHSSASGLAGVSNYLINNHSSSFDLQQTGNGRTSSLQQHQQQQQQHLTTHSSLRRASSRADIDLLERDTNLQMRVSYLHQ